MSLTPLRAVTQNFCASHLTKKKHIKISNTKKMTFFLQNRDIKRVQTKCSDGRKSAHD